MARKDEIILFMEDYEGNPTAVPESKALQFQQRQEELMKNPPPQEPLDPEIQAFFQEAARRIQMMDSKDNADS